MDDQKPPNPYQPSPPLAPTNEGQPHQSPPNQAAPYQAPPYQAPNAPHYGGGFGTAPYMGGPGYDAIAPYGGADEYTALATRGSRFAARLLDGLILLLFAIPGIVILAMQGSVDFTQPLPLVAIGAGVLAISIYQWMRIVRTGQTIGKSALNIKVVKNDGRPVGFVDGVLVREWSLSLMGVVPFIGRFIGLIDALMIFGEDRRCLHDRLATTKVIAVMPTMPGMD